MREILTEMRIPESSRLVGRTVISEQISDRFRLTVLEILRGRRKIPEARCRPGPGKILS